MQNKINILGILPRDITNRFLEVYGDHVGVKSAGKETQGHFCDLVGITASNLGRLIREKENNISLQQLINLVVYYKVSPGWMILGEGQKYRAEEQLTGPRLKKQLETLQKNIESVIKSIDVQRAPLTPTVNTSRKKASKTKK